MTTILLFFKSTIIEFMKGLSLPYSIILSGVLILSLIVFREKIINSFLRTKKAVPEGLTWFRDENPDAIGHFFACLPQKSLLLTIYCVAFASTMSINFQIPGITFLASSVFYVLLSLAFVRRALITVIGLFTTTAAFLYATGDYYSAAFSVSVVAGIFIISFSMKLFFTWNIVLIQRILRSLMPLLVA